MHMYIISASQGEWGSEALGPPDPESRRREGVP